MSAAVTLPDGFAVLEPFVKRWDVSKTAERAALRTASSVEERDAFFAAANPLMDLALSHLDAHPLNALPPPERRLMNLMLSLAHIALAVEIQGSDEKPSAPWRNRMRITRSTADKGAL